MRQPPKINRFTTDKIPFYDNTCKMFFRGQHPDERTQREWVIDMKVKGFKNVDFK